MMGESKGDSDAKKTGKAKKPVKYVSSYSNAELVFDPFTKTLRFCVYNPESDSYTFVDQLETPTEVLKPHPTIAKYAKEDAAFLPSKPEEYDDTQKLADEIYRFLRKWVDYPDEYRRLDVWYAFYTWVYDRFPTAIYRRALGKTSGCGKSTWLKVLGSICYRAFIQGAAATPATVFRLSDIFRGTQLIDENYFDLRTEVGQAIIAILNSGYDKTTGFVTRCVGDANIPTLFVSFGPKLVAARIPFPDDATEHRTITHQAYRAKGSVPVQLDEEFWKESLALRNKLLMWRFRHLGTKFTPDPKLLSMDIDPRTKQILLPLSAVIEDEEVKEWLRKLAKRLSDDIADVRSESLEANVLRAIFELKKRNEPLQVKAITEEFKKINPDYPLPLTPRSMGRVLRETLGLTVKRAQVGKNVPYVVVWNDEQMRRLAATYGLEEEFEDILTSLTSLTSGKGWGEGSKASGPSGPSGYPEVKEVKNVKVEHTGQTSLAKLIERLDEATEHGQKELGKKDYEAIVLGVTEGDVKMAVELTRKLAKEGVLRYNKDRGTVTFIPPKAPIG